jgi:hypothetical protein
MEESKGRKKRNIDKTKDSKVCLFLTQGGRRET